MIETKLCKRCDRDLPLSDFYTSPSNRHPCKKCQSKVALERRLANPERHNAQKRASSARYREKNRARVNENLRHWRANNRERLGVKRRKDYVENREKYRVKSAKHRAARREWFDSLKVGPCADCGGTFPPCVYDFHHVNGHKELTVSKTITIAKYRLEREIAKCVLLCANCHRVRTQGERING